MKNPLLCFSAIVLVLLYGCNQPEAPKPLTETQKASLKTEIRSRIDKMMANSEAGNMDGVMEVYHNNPEFLAVVNGEILDYTAYKAAHKAYFDKLDTQKFTQVETRFLILCPFEVLVTFKGAAKARMSNGDLVRLDPYTASLTFKKIDRIWKVVHSNETFTMVPLKVKDSTILE
ncbi:MAG TPA: hypothetical protein VKZ97_05760 [Flavobacteriaceae bacterium]|nr:hypothetical protein [Flavobacteriaceae bacterium]